MRNRKKKKLHSEKAVKSSGGQSVREWHYDACPCSHLKVVSHELPLVRGATCVYTDTLKP